MATTNTDRADANHLTGDYYFVNDVAPWKWYAAAFLCIVLPPVGVFFVVWYGLGCVTTLDESRV